jgi:indolepyruvate ferredoxin oxidoreductase, beta subunit
MKKISLKKDIILAGVGGQGILSIASVIDWAALQIGLNIKQAEVHGMSQRGGSVQSHLRISDQIIYSDLISKKGADLIISVEPLEALRYLPFLKEQGWIVTSSNAFKNIDNYPAEEKLFEELEKLSKKVILDADKIARSCGSLKTSNMVILGAASEFIGIDNELLKNGISALFSAKGEELVKMNIDAFEAGRAIQRNIQGIF